MEQFDSLVEESSKVQMLSKCVLANSTITQVSISVS